MKETYRKAGLVVGLTECVRPASFLFLMATAADARKSNRRLVGSDLRYENNMWVDMQSNKPLPLME